MGKDDFKQSKQPCWNCKKYCGGCDWSRFFKPIKGWVAERHFIINGREKDETFKIKSCPEFEDDGLSSKIKSKEERARDLGISMRTFYRKVESLEKDKGFIALLEKIRGN